MIGLFLLCSCTSACVQQLCQCVHSSVCGETKSFCLSHSELKSISTTNFSAVFFQLSCRKTELFIHENQQQNDFNSVKSHVVKVSIIWGYGSFLCGQHSCLPFHVSTWKGYGREPGGNGTWSDNWSSNITC